MNHKASPHAQVPIIVDGKPIDFSSFAATDAKNEFGHMLDMVISGHPVLITKHDTPKAVMLSYEEFQVLAKRGERQLDTLRSEFDDLLTKMQTPEARAAIVEAFDATPAELRKIAVASTKGKPAR